MAGGFEHPHGLAPPPDWFEPGRHVTSAEYRKWLAMKPGQQTKGAKFHQKAGRRADLGNLYLKSKLEANVLRLLLFLGFVLWTQKGVDPPHEGCWVAYEWRRFRLVANAGKETEKPVLYLPDFHIWQDGEYSLWEAKGVMDQRSKRLLRLMAEQHPEIALTVITAGELAARKMEALLRARRERNEPGILDVPGWE